MNQLHAARWALLNSWNLSDPSPGLSGQLAHEPTPWERWHPAGEPAEKTNARRQDAGAPRFMVPIHVRFWKTLLPMNRHNAIRFLGSPRRRFSSVSVFAYVRASWKMPVLFELQRFCSIFSAHTYAKIDSISPSILPHGFRGGFPIELGRSTLPTCRLRMHGRPKGPSFLSPGHRPGYLLMTTMDLIGMPGEGTRPARDYARLKIALLSVVVLSANDSRSIPIDRKMERCTLDIRVSPFRQ